MKKMKIVLNFALCNAIAQHNVNMIYLCIENGAEITNEMIKTQNIIEILKKSENQNCTLLYDTLTYCHYNDNFKILLENGFDIYISKVIIQLLKFKHHDNNRCIDGIKKLLNFGINIYNYQLQIMDFFKRWIDKYTFLSYNRLRATKILIKYMRPSKNKYANSYNILFNQYMLITQNFDLTQGILTNYSGINDISHYIIDYYKYIIKTTNHDCITYLLKLMDQTPEILSDSSSEED